MDDREWWSVVCALRAGRADPGVEAYSRLEPVRVQVARMRGLSDRVLRSLARDESVNDAGDGGDAPRPARGSGGRPVVG
ncbi:MAG: hypothetical protein ACLRL4_11080 [Bifidobacterium bifidum]